MRSVDLQVVNDERELLPHQLSARGDDMFYAKNISGMRLFGVRVFSDVDALSKWTSKFKTEDCDGLLIKDCEY